MNIKELLEVEDDIWINGLTEDYKEVEEGYLFVATTGFYQDHFDYIEEAIKRGCSYLVVDRELSFSFPHKIVENINEVYKELCKKFYQVELSNFHFIGITGTDGKTTTTTIVKDLLNDCALIGTNGVIIKNKTYPTKNTTPCVREFYEILQHIQQEKITNIVMEVSSEALLHERVNQISYDIIGFTNITEDHLNVHKNREEYIKCKMKLLDLVKENGKVIVNGDDVNLQKIQCKNLYTFGYQKHNDFQIKNVRKTAKDIKITIEGKEQVELLSPLKGKFNVYNVVMAYLIGKSYGIKKELLQNRLKKIENIPGRCEFLDFGQEYTIILDYAHTINAIKNILESFSSRRKIVVTGCAGGRDKTKRPIIGNMILKKADIAIFTMDDPRYERVEDIIKEMVKNEKEYKEIINREEAIFYALSLAKKNDIVFILGKGRDNYMAIEDKKIPYNDYDVIKKYFQKAK